jgi:hypothetical protein
MSPPSAWAWANGGNGGDGFGTHDWILHQALSLADDGASWVDREAALKATDDPDTGPVDPVDHVYYPNIDYGGAPHMVAEHFALALAARKAGDIREASRHLGILSHYYADICVPYHAAKQPVGSAERARHDAYEADVGYRQLHANATPDWVMPARRAPLLDVRARAIAASVETRAFTERLDTAYRDGGLTGDALIITTGRLSRAVNDLADVIIALSEERGASEPGTVRLSMGRQYLRQHYNAQAIATVQGVNGKPLRGVRVLFDWGFPGESKTTTWFTDANGVAVSWANTGSTRWRTVVPVIARTRLAHSTSSWRSWFMTTDVIAPGATGIRTTVSNYRPSRLSRVTATTTLKNTAGRTIPGVRITFTWRFPSGSTYRAVAVTDARGRATSTRGLGATASGESVSVRAQTQWGASTRSSTATFVVR